MALKNTADNYGAIAKWIHWLTALLFLGAYLSVYYRHWFTEYKTPENWTALQLHLSFGVTVGVLVVLRIIWRAKNRLPDDEPGSKLAHLAAHWGHYALYGVLIIVPLTGYIGTGVDTEFYFLFNIPEFGNTALFEAVVVNGLGLDFETFEKPIDFIHKALFGELLTLLLVGGHIAAALYHHFVKKDRTLKKMTSGNA
ncbi:cytochrome b [Alteromonas lipolytica]|uniref:Cytochrome B n=1 Tax=Alteromonas lipolytica TaxID=1856405 RepID=A0A1E8FJC9_9ALTE|nr:cytochrome b/b6 domain-containing protein [Alteromonas lipolytica]OFI36025.1 cytochrome B [Alteromonas lipolytica]GGF71582.1 cytochrome b [Alteromonas lipolytica]